MAEWREVSREWWEVGKDGRGHEKWQGTTTGHKQGGWVAQKGLVPSTAGTDAWKT